MLNHLKLVPWESWQLWSRVCDALFSSSPESALNKVAAWRSRSSLPISVEITADLINIQRKDPHFSGICSPENIVTGDMLRLMYSMAIMRLVNGVVDQSKWQNSTSVAERAEAAGLPRMLVDIRHEVAHKELPSLAFLQLASKKALQWLKVHYWEAQKQVLHDSSEHIKRELYDYSSKDRSKGSRVKKDLENLIKLVSSAVPEVVTILVNEGLLERCASGDKMWQSVIGELSLNVPRLSRELISLCIKGSKRDESSMRLLSFLLDHSPWKYRSHHASRLAEMSDAVLQLQVELDDSDAEDRYGNCSNGNLGGAAGSSGADETVDGNLKDSEKSILEAVKNVHVLCKRRHGILGASNSREVEVTAISKTAWTVADENWRPCAIGKLPDSIETSGVLPSFGTTLPTTELEGETCQTTCGGEVLNDASTETAATNVMVVDDNTVRSDDPRTLVPAAEITKSKGKRHVENASEEENTFRRIKERVGFKYNHKDARIHSNASSAQQEKKSIFSGLVLLDGAYKRCRIDKLNAIQSSIQLLK